MLCRRSGTWLPSRSAVAALTWRPALTSCAFLGAPLQYRRTYATAAAATVPFAAANPADEDDFVFYDAQPAAHPGASNAVVAEAAAPECFVVRERVAAEGAERTRLRLPVETPRGGAPVPREGSRAFNLAPEPTAEQLAEYVAESGASASPGWTTPNTDEERQHRTEAAARDSALPFEDERMAAMVLEMEVSGHIDDSWQDARRAHFEDVQEIVAVLRESNVRDVVVIDTSCKTAAFDYIVFGTCEGMRHIHLAAWAVQEADKFQGVTKNRRQRTDDEWEVVTVGRILVNLMVPEFRERGSLERKWAVCSTMDPLQAAGPAISEGRQFRVHGIWSLTLNLQDLEDFEVDYCKEALLSQR